MPVLDRRVGLKRPAAATELAQGGPRGVGQHRLAWPLGLMQRHGCQRLQSRDQPVPAMTAEGRQHGAPLAVAQTSDVAHQQAYRGVGCIRPAAQIIRQPLEQHVHIAKPAAMTCEPTTLAHQFGGILYRAVTLERAECAAQAAQFHPHIVQRLDIGVAFHAGHQRGKPPGRAPEEGQQRLTFGGNGRVQHEVSSLERRENGSRARTRSCYSEADQGTRRLG